MPFGHRSGLAACHGARPMVAIVYKVARNFLNRQISCTFVKSTDRQKHAKPLLLAAQAIKKGRQVNRPSPAGYV